MNLFISWSGIRSHNIAKALKKWLEEILPVKVWISSEDIKKGSRSLLELSEALEKNDFGIFCITKENEYSPWIHFEAGAISKSIDRSRIFTILFDLVPKDLLDSPLSEFQHTFYKQEDMQRLLENINNLLTGKSKLGLSTLFAAFDGRWKMLDEEIKKALHPDSKLHLTKGHIDLPNTRKLRTKDTVKRYTSKYSFHMLCVEIRSQYDRFKIIPATGVARAVLHQEQYEMALRLFEFLLFDVVTSFDTEKYIIYGNIGYCLVGMKFYKEAIAHFEYVKNMTNGKEYFGWHAIPAAYCYWMIGEKDKFKMELDYAKSTDQYHKELERSKILYPEIKKYL